MIHLEDATQDRLDQVLLTQVLDLLCPQLLIVAWQSHQPVEYLRYMTYDCCRHIPISICVYTYRQPFTPMMSLDIILIY